MPYNMYKAAMTKDIRFEMRLDAATVATLDDLRRKEPDLPTRAEMIRRLISSAGEQPGDEGLAALHASDAVFAGGDGNAQ